MHPVHFILSLLVLFDVGITIALVIQRSVYPSCSMMETGLRGRGLSASKDNLEHESNRKVQPETYKDRYSRRSEALSRFMFGSASIFAFPLISHAEKGAFEMDVEYYVLDLLGANPYDKKKTFQNRPIYKSPRQVDATFASEIIAIVSDQICALGGISPQELARAVETSLPFMIKYFKTFAPITKEDVSDQYYLDMLLYIYYLEGGKIITESERRVELRNRVGDAVLQLLRKKYGLSDLPSVMPRDLNGAAAGVKSLADGVSQILAEFARKGIVAGYSFDADDVSDEQYALSSFSEVRYDRTVPHYHHHHSHLDCLR